MQYSARRRYSSRVRSHPVYKDVAFGVIDVDQGIADFNKALYDAGLQRVIDEKQRQLDEWLANKDK